LLQFDFNTKKWEELDTTHYPESRRNFAFAVIGDKYLAVYGGIYGDNQYLSDISFLNMGIFLFLKFYK
jgi:hypothetical protein